MKEVNYKKLAKFVIPLILALISIFVISKYATKPEFHINSIQALDEKKMTVMELTAASTAASTAITLLPGDTATPIAEKLADLSSYFLIVICAIYLEKYLLIITGYATFVVLIPLACIIYSINVFKESDSLKYLAKKLAIFGLAIVLIIPASIKVSTLIETIYQDSIEATINSAKDATKAIENDIDTSTNDVETEEKDNLFSDIFSNVKNSVSSVTSNTVSNAKNMLNRFVDALAVMLVTSCFIPILVLLFFVWLIKIMLGIEIPVSNKIKPYKL